MLGNDRNTLQSVFDKLPSALLFANAVIQLQEKNAHLAIILTAEQKATIVRNNNGGLTLIASMTTELAAESMLVSDILRRVHNALKSITPPDETLLNLCSTFHEKDIKGGTQKARDLYAQLETYQQEVFSK